MPLREKSFWVCRDKNTAVDLDSLRRAKGSQAGLLPRFPPTLSLSSEMMFGVLYAVRINVAILRGGPGRGPLCRCIRCVPDVLHQYSWRACLRSALFMPPGRSGFGCSYDDQGFRPR